MDDPRTRRTRGNVDAFEPHDEARHPNNPLDHWSFGVDEADARGRRTAVKRYGGGRDIQRYGTG